MTFAVIDLTYVFNYIIDILTYIFAFCKNVLVFQIGTYQFNMITFCLAGYSLGLAINAFFGMPTDDPDFVQTYDNWEDI